VFKFLLPADIEEMCVSYLSNTFSNVAIEMKTNAALPFILVTCIDDPEDMVTATAAIQVDAFHTSMTLASATARQSHQQMKNLVGVPVLMSNATYANIDCIEVIEGPHWVDYGSKEIWRYVARYHIDRRCNLSS
jgi:hypothetical protein